MDALGTETFELLRDAYQVIDGIPDQRLLLTRWQQQFRGIVCEPACNTIACAGGWLTLHPGFKAIGLAVHSPSIFGEPEYNGLLAYKALAAMFGIGEDTAVALFHPFGRHFAAHKYDPTPGEAQDMTDRDMWLYRVRKFLASVERA